MALKVYQPTRALQILEAARFGVMLLISAFLSKIWGSGDSLLFYERFIFWQGAFSFFWVWASGRLLLTEAKREAGTLSYTFYLTLSGGLLSGALVAVVLCPITSFGQTIPYAFAAFLQLFSVHFEYYYFSQEKYKELLLTAFLTFGLQFFIIVGGAGIDAGLIVIGWSLVGLYLIRAILFIFFIQKNKLLLSFSKANARAYWSRFGPLAGVAILGGLGVYWTGWLVETFAASEFVAYRYGARELPFFTAFANAVSAASAARLTEENTFSDQLTHLRNETGRLILIFAPIAALLILFSDFIFETVYTRAFMKAADIFRVYVLLLVPRLFFPQPILLALSRQKFLFRVAVAELLLHCTLATIFVWYWGAIGAAYATLFAYIFEKIPQIYYLTTRENIKISYYVPIKRLILAAITIGICFVFVELKTILLDKK